MDIRHEVLGTSAILERAVNDVISLDESKEMARNALPASASGISSFKRDSPTGGQTGIISATASLCSIPACAMSRLETHIWTLRPHRQRTPCQTRLTHPHLRDGCRIRAIIIAERLIWWGQPTVTPRRRRRRHRRRGRDHRENVPRPADVLANAAHHNFNKGHWRRARFLSRPGVKLTMSVNASYYQAFSSDVAAP